MCTLPQILQGRSNQRGWCGMYTK